MKQFYTFKSLYLDDFDTLDEAMTEAETIMNRCRGYKLRRADKILCPEVHIWSRGGRRIIRIVQ